MGWSFSTRTGFSLGRKQRNLRGEVKINYSLFSSLDFNISNRRTRQEWAPGSLVAERELQWTEDRSFLLQLKMDLLDRVPSEKDLVFQSKILCRDFIYSRITREGLNWSKVEAAAPVPDGSLGDVSVVLLKLGEKSRFEDK